MSTLSKIFDPAIIAEWCAQARAAHALAAAPIFEGDPKRDELVARYGGLLNVAEHGPEDLGELYSHDAADLPAWPIRPDWVEEVTIYGTMYPEIGVLMQGMEWRVGSQVTRIEQNINIVLEDELADDGSIGRPAGWYEIDDVKISTGSADYEPETAMDLSIALEDAVHSLRGFTAAPAENEDVA